MAKDGNERGQRVRVGLTGLAAVLVVVAAATAVVESVRDEPPVADLANAAAVNAAAPAAATSEPLAEIGVLPSGDATNATESDALSNAAAVAPEMEPAPTEAPDLAEPPAR